MTAQPWMKWYPADWRADPNLRVCSPIARYVWMEMLGLMHEAEPYGHLLLNGRPLNATQLSRIFGMDAGEVSRAIAELGEAHVFIKIKGVIVSEKMISEGRPASKRPAIPLAVVRAVWARDGSVCSYCGTEEGPFHLDHKHPYSRGGGHTVENLCVACVPCNMQKKDLTVEEWRA